MKSATTSWCPFCPENLTLTQVGIVVAVLTLSFLMRRIFIFCIFWFVKKRGKETDSEIIKGIIATLSGPLSLIFIITGIYITEEILDFPESVDKIMARIAESMVTFSLFWALYLAVQHFTSTVIQLWSKAGASISREIEHFIVLILKTIIMGIGAISILQCWNVNVAALLGGFGIITAAVAFASQDTIANFFGSVTVFMDGTFKVGDWIRTPDLEGIVEHIGIRTTSVRRKDKALVVIPNVKLANAAVINFSQMTSREVSWKVGLALETTAVQLNNIVTKFRDYLEKNPDIETDPKKVTTLIFVDGINQSAFDVLLTFFTKATDSATYMQVKQDCLLAFREIVENEGAQLVSPEQFLRLVLPQTSDSTSLKDKKKIDS